ncbi:uncharacterized protein BO80DRAFT_129995 [Aspergillus ibericus CBS 121593]|uniref:Uncharacterized protein n=1 Tax=Aspergillus ibericus CBS 121593 TaxID=1448316 RepID=A0A395HBW0_9EURO|nr:hypothetical protein BO80DRAFT_129995 [Aspergillus ibericus CBS 121593]RAL05190.1 hypothetical protein BO80DRAFT_129995 [Aspergillus ibericus CBS 121593]
MTSPPRPLHSKTPSISPYHILQTTHLITHIYTQIPPPPTILRIPSQHVNLVHILQNLHHGPSPRARPHRRDLQYPGRRPRMLGILELIPEISHLGVLDQVAGSD